MADPGFSPGGAPTPKIAIIFHIFAENCMKMKEFGPPGRGARPWRPPLDPPMEYVLVCHQAKKRKCFSNIKKDHTLLGLYESVSRFYELSN